MYNYGYILRCWNTVHGGIALKALGPLQLLNLVQLTDRDSESYRSYTGVGRSDHVNSVKENILFRIRHKLY